MADGSNNLLEESNEQIEVRRQKLAKLKETGSVVYPNDFRPSHTASEIVANFTDADDAAFGGRTAGYSRRRADHGDPPDG